ncbi:phage shock protein operon transcriptional activator [Pseudokordiimonas caeni]|uniref:phage shock protein operon transcriptional activator n=1 Tax=Pseudokordiimonas caeni TaxID=2997908 RepID=UPI00281155F8|nr:phage shock protein operon transcriptional activator [Pseudokordiimonas caeni]
MISRDDSLIGSAPAFLDLIDQVSRAAPLDRPLLVIGERGTGKELIAARLHFLSNRWDKAYQKLNCAALPETLLESELFGYEPGAFTGAAKRRAGRFEAAHEGTLFLDEIGNMSLNAQEKLLRVIEYGEFERVGGTETQQVDVRVIGATNIDLPAAADDGKFRHDLLDRLAFDVLTIPPLRARPEDIPELADHFGRSMAHECEWPSFPGFTERAMDQLVSYDWPGNIRELKNVIERAVYSAWDGEDPIDAIVFDPFNSPFRPRGTTSAVGTKKVARQTERSVDMAERLPASNGERALRDGIAALGEGASVDYRAAVAAAECDMLEAALKACRYNQRAAADRLGLSYDQLRHAMKKHGLTGPSEAA